MPQPTLTRRVEILEETVDAVVGLLREFRADVQKDLAAVREEICAGDEAIRQDMRAEFAAVREEIRAGDEAIRQDMRTEFAAVREEIRAGDEETRRQMRVLHEDVIARLQTLGEGLGAPRGGRRSRKPS
ncbi:MAG TPA: hypothetical protein VNE16_09700 [Vicinamibacterales bacterium]|nr:hypothetical protein [Vicinamibacterales bacterium]